MSKEVTRVAQAHGRDRCGVVAFSSQGQLRAGGSLWV